MIGMKDHGTFTWRKIMADVINFPLAPANANGKDHDLTISTLVFSCGHSTCHLVEDGSVACSVCLEPVRQILWFVDDEEDDNVS